mgnify:CR=1 FL=1
MVAPPLTPKLNGLIADCAEAAPAVSATAHAATRKTKPPGSCHSSHHGDQACVSAMSESDPPAMAIDASASTIGSS